MANKIPSEQFTHLHIRKCHTEITVVLLDLVIDIISSGQQVELI